MRITILQNNCTVGDITNNSSKIINLYKEAVANGAELVCAPELAICGYPPQDLIFRPAFVAAMDKALSDMAKEVGAIPLIVGTIRKHPDSLLAYNCGVVLQYGNIINEIAKQLLPNHDVFDERRYFAPGEHSTVVTVNGLKIGLTICEDFWNDREFWRLPRYDYDPIPKLVADGAQLLINIAASPYAMGKVAYRQEIFSAEATKWSLPIIYANQIGGQDGLVFDGNSMIIDAKGQLVAKGAAFAEEVISGEITIPTGSTNCHHLAQGGRYRPDTAILPRPQGWEKEVADALCLGLKDYMAKCGFKKALIGLSGGIDSALVATLAVRALGADKVHGITMPSRYSPADSPNDAQNLATALGITFDTVPIEPMFARYLDSLAPIFGEPPWGVTQENIQARIRGTILMAYSNKNGNLLIATGNKSELAVGYATLYGDMCGGLELIGDLFKTDVYRVAKFLNEEAGRELIPVSTLTKPPSAELAPGQRDQDSLPPYDVLDDILRRYLEGNQDISEILAAGHDRETVERVFALVKRAEYKRVQAAPVVKISGLSFGAGRRYPVAHVFKA